LLDYVSRTNLIGKPYANDLKEKKITLPLIHALRSVPKSISTSIVGMIKRGNLQSSDINHIMSFVKEHGGIEYAQNKAQVLIEEAISLLDVFPDSEYKSSLKDFAIFVIERQS
jgi:octaprenyl-diphosphate synthase